jgi:putative flippase GtrA
MTVIEQLRFRFPRAAAVVEPRLGFVKKAISFGLVGVVNAAIDFAVFWPATHALGLPKDPAKVLSWMVAVSASYVMNSLITFAAESGRKLRWRAYGAFVLSGVAGMVASVVALDLAERLLRGLILDHDLRLAAAWICSIGASFVVNFSLSHFVVFRQRAET